MLLRCYPRITDFIYFLFGQRPAADYRFLPIYSYGFFVAIGFFAAASIAVAELRRREQLKLLTGVEAETTIGLPPDWKEILLAIFLSFTAFYKLIGIFTYHDVLRTGTLDFMRYMLARPDGSIFVKFASVFTYGSWVGGIAGSLIFTAYYLYSRNKQKLAVPEKKKITIYPSDSIGDLLVIAMVLGVLGSNLFNFMENPDDYQNFWKDPFGSIFSGLSVYGGLICAGIGFWVYAYVKKFNIAPFFDSIAPGFILANGIGRLGCQTAGDGDWGVVNLQPKPAWLPQFLWSSHYQHNIIDADPQNIIAGCNEAHCHFLTNPVYPTPIYEFLMCLAVFFILWAVRKRLTFMPGVLFGVFMILIGIQRYCIEQWRDLSGRDLYHIFGFAFKQSEIISIILFILGIALTAALYNHYRKHPLQHD